MSGCFSFFCIIGEDSSFLIALSRCLTDIFSHRIDESIVWCISRYALWMGEDIFLIVVFDFTGDDIPVADDESLRREVAIEECDITHIPDDVVKLYLIELLCSSGELLLGDDLSDD